MALVQCHDCGTFVEHDTVQLRERETAVTGGGLLDSLAGEPRKSVRSRVNICRECAKNQDRLGASLVCGVFLGVIVAVGTSYIIDWVTDWKNQEINSTAAMTGIVVAIISALWLYMFPPE
jgi:hypothetical protein